ncbi:MAG: dCTP deaminase [Terriglobia bacterium]
MQLLPGKLAAQRLKNLMNEKHQVHAYHIDLTACKIYGMNPTGEVDFGGSEYIPAQPQELRTHQKHSQDRYQWWELHHGAYRVDFNEALELADNEIALLETHERLLRAGASHPANFVRGRVDPLHTLLSVTSARIQIKQNARIATLRVFQLAPAAKTPRAKARAPAKKIKKKRR